MVRPRPTVVIGLFSLSLGGIGLMIWGIDHEYWGVILVGGGLSVLGGFLTGSIYWPELSKILEFRKEDRGTQAEILVAIVMIVVSVALPPFLYSYREQAASIQIIDENTYVNAGSPQESFAENYDIQNQGSLDAVSANRGCYFQPSYRILTAAEEDEGVKKAQQNITPAIVTGIPARFAPKEKWRVTCHYNLSRQEYDDVKDKRQYLYSFMVIEYIDDKLTYGKKRVLERCGFMYGRFNVVDHCVNRHHGTYVRAD
jgi:hypothetical protein